MPLATRMVVIVTHLSLREFTVASPSLKTTHLILGLP
jgi:hypothetical protein